MENEKKCKKKESEGENKRARVYRGSICNNCASEEGVSTRVRRICSLFYDQSECSRARIQYSIAWVVCGSGSKFKILQNKSYFYRFFLRERGGCTSACGSGTCGGTREAPILKNLLFDWRTFGNTNTG